MFSFVIWLILCVCGCFPFDLRVQIQKNMAKVAKFQHRSPKETKQCFLKQIHFN